jgi:hypothetical protein
MMLDFRDFTWFVRDWCKPHFCKLTPMVMVRVLM